MKYHPRKSIWIRRCKVCNHALATWNKSGLCNSCHKDIYNDKRKENTLVTKLEEKNNGK